MFTLESNEIIAFWANENSLIEPIVIFYCI